MPQYAGVQDSIFCMNTHISLRIHGEKADPAFKRAKPELSRLEKKLSRFIQNSEVSRINRSAGKGSVVISSETCELLSKAIRFAEISQGLFDITVGPLVDLWDFQHSICIPEESSIRSTLAFVNFHDLILNPTKNTAGLQKVGQSVDLGGIGKGYASDRFIKVLQEYGITSAFINIGGNVSTLGNKPDSSPWSVGIRHPRQYGCLLGAVKITGKAVVTSGDYERFFVDDAGKRWHHILNPTTGYPAESGLISVTVVDDCAMSADALATAIFAAGLDKGLEYMEQFSGAEAVLVNNCEQVFITHGLKESFQAVEGVEVSLI